MKILKTSKPQHPKPNKTTPTAAMRKFVLARTLVWLALYVPYPRDAIDCQINMCRVRRVNCRSTNAQCAFEWCGPFRPAAWSRRTSRMRNAKAKVHAYRAGKSSSVASTKLAQSMSAAAGLSSKANTASTPAMQPLGRASNVTVRKEEVYAVNELIHDSKGGFRMSVLRERRLRSSLTRQQHAASTNNERAAEIARTRDEAKAEAAMINAFIKSKGSLHAQANEHAERGCESPPATEDGESVESPPAEKKKKKNKLRQSLSRRSDVGPHMMIREQNPTRGSADSQGIGTASDAYAMLLAESAEWKLQYQELQDIIATLKDENEILQWKLAQALSQAHDHDTTSNRVPRGSELIHVMREKLRASFGSLKNR